MRHLSIKTTTTTSGISTMIEPTREKHEFNPPATINPQQRSPWHSPVPYLFGGLAAMLGLIAFALLLLACSYWKLSGRLTEAENEERARDIESGGGEKHKGFDEKVMNKVYEEKILVIMAGEEKPTFLATPVSCKCSTVSAKDENKEGNEGERVESEEKVKEEESRGDHDDDQEERENH